ncbi:putative aldouronate transport system substrate-binding protein [Gracilibacillus orientalis]|uniref:Putative aldouronate transport system substrate-binding protein n=2 Tax=Gracilibacillus orientalis TaxID=334253 RepID=A0A1I4HXI6_9BACI|nr:putative aldouronate transport system substrate-binding protein [Gracilibacillus orientalis]
MKNMYRSLLTLTSVLLGILLIAGCGNSEKASSENYELNDITFPLEEEVTLKFMTESSPMAPEDPNDKLILQRLEEESGVHIEWKNYTGESFAEKRNLAVASGELPDAIMNAGYSDYELLDLANDEAIIPVEDLIDQYMPNLQAVLEQAPEYRAMMTAPDGHIYAFPWIEELGAGKESIHSLDATGWINVEWLDELGLDMPSTTEELKEALVAFKENDMAGDGQTIPMSFIINHGGEDLSFLFSPFGEGDNWDHTVVSNDDEVIFTTAQEEYREGINYLHELYELDLMDVEAFEQDWNSYLAKGKEERYGLYFTWDKANITGQNDKYQLLPPVEGPDGRKHVARSNGMGFDRARMVITSANENLELTAKWIDQLYDPHQSVQNNWGTYGDEEKQNIFEYDEGENMLRHLSLEGTAPVELREETSVGGPLAILDEYYGDVTTMPDDAAWRLEILHEELVPYMNNDNIYPKVFMTLEELDDLSTIEADLFPYVERKKAEWISNGNVDEEWEEYLTELDRLGYQEWLEIKQTAYDRNAKE